METLRGGEQKANGTTAVRTAAEELAIDIDKDAHETMLSRYGSLLYGLVVVILGIVSIIVEIVDSVDFPTAICTGYLMFIYLLSIVFLLYLIYEVYIRKDKDEDHVGNASGKEPASEAVEDAYRVKSDTDEEANEKDKPTSSSRWKQLGHAVRAANNMQKSTRETEKIRYRLARAITTGSMSHVHTSIFLRVGICVFSACYLSYVLMGVIIYEMLSRDEEYPCIASDLMIRYALIFFVIFQTVFIALGTNVSITRRKASTRFGLVHLMAANMIIWVYTLIEEIQHTLHYWVDEGEDPMAESPDSPPSNSTVIHARFARAVSSSYDSNSSELAECYSSTFEDAKPYLIPFIHEYSLVLIGCLVSIFVSLQPNIGEALLKHILSPDKEEEHADTSSQKKSHNFHRAKVGIVFGALVLFLTAICCCIEYVYYYDDNKAFAMGLTIYDLLLQVIACLVLIVAIVKIYPFQVSYTRDNSVDSTMLLIAFAGFTVIILIGIMIDLPTGNEPGQYIAFVKALLEFFFGLVQTVFILVGMHRMANSEKQRDEKPGRNALAYLVAANIAHWLYESFIPEGSFISTNILQFGPYLAATILDVSIPLVLFFRFHSAVCLAHMYHALYEEE